MSWELVYAKHALVGRLLPAMQAFTAWTSELFSNARSRIPEQFLHQYIKFFALFVVDLVGRQQIR